MESSYPSPISPFLYCTEWILFWTSLSLFGMSLLKSLMLSIKTISYIVPCFSSRYLTRSNIYSFFLFEICFFISHFSIFSFQNFLLWVLSFLLDFIKCWHNSVIMFLKFRNLRITTFLVVFQLFDFLLYTLFNLLHILFLSFRKSLL